MEIGVKRNYAVITAIIVSISNMASAGSITYQDDQFISGERLTASSMNAPANEVKAAVNDNDAKLEVLTNTANQCGTGGSINVMSGVDATGKPICVTPSGNGAGYSDQQAVNAMGTTGDTNSYNHNKFAPINAQEAMGATVNSNPLNHDRYTDALARTANATAIAAKQPSITGSCSSIDQKMIDVNPATGAIVCGIDNIGPSSNYTFFSSLAKKPLFEVRDTFVKLEDVGPFTKNLSTSFIEVSMNTSLYFTSDFGVTFQIRIDDVATTLGRSEIYVKPLQSGDFFSIDAVFPGILAGPHTVSIWVKASPGRIASQLIVDQGGDAGHILIKETR